MLPVSAQTRVVSAASRMGPRRDDSFERPPSTLGGDFSAHVEAIVRAAEREARAAERAIEERRREAEDEVHRYLAAARLHVDAAGAARAARLASLTSATRRLADELTDATAALNAELARGEEELSAAVPHAPWPTAAQPAHAEPRSTWSRAAGPPPPPPPARSESTNGAGDPSARVAETEPAPSPEIPVPVAAATGGEVPSAARLVAIEMAVGGFPRADVERHLREQFGVADPAALLDDVFGAASHAGSRLAWGEP